MRRSVALPWVSSVIVVLAAVATVAGLFWPGGGAPFPFTTVRGQTVQIYGQGLYHYDTPLVATGLKMADAVTLVLGIPLLVVAIVLYRRGSLRGGLLLAGVLAYFLYNYVSMSFGATYNVLFLVYVALLSLSLFGLVLVLSSYDLQALPAHYAQRLPRRGIGIYLIISGVVLLLVWLVLSIVPALLQGEAPVEVAYYTTTVTFALDLGIIGPALIVAGALLLRRAPSGYLLASMLLFFTAVIGVNLTAGGIAQVLARLIAIGQFIGMTASFTILTLFAIRYAIILWHDFQE